MIRTYKFTDPTMGLCTITGYDNAEQATEHLGTEATEVFLPDNEMQALLEMEKVRPGTNTRNPAKLYPRKWKGETEVMVRPSPGDQEFHPLYCGDD
jgi:hypothetical protein